MKLTKRYIDKHVAVKLDAIVWMVAVFLSVQCTYMINSDELITMFICSLSKLCFKNVLYVKKKKTLKN